VQAAGAGTARKRLWDERVDGHPLKIVSTNHRDSPFSTSMSSTWVTEDVATRRGAEAPRARNSRYCTAPGTAVHWNLAGDEIARPSSSGSRGMGVAVLHPAGG
jgi:hypothetical protein